MTGAGYIELGNASNLSITYISDMYVGDFGLLPKATDVVGGATVYYCDTGTVHSNSQTFATFGGDANDGSQCGIFNVSLADYYGSLAMWYNCAFISCKPLSNVTDIGPVDPTGGEVTEPTGPAGSTNIEDFIGPTGPTGPTGPIGELNIIYDDEN